jgi:cell division transport system permease protein
MRAIGYHLGRALRGATGRPFGLVLALGSIALAFVLLGAIVLVSGNLTRLTDGWGSGATVAVDLVADVPPADAARVKQAIRETPGVSAIRDVSPTEAKRRLLRELGPRAALVADVEDGFLPRTLEVTLSGDRSVVHEAQRRLERMAGAVPGVDHVATVQTWFHDLDRLIAGLRWGGAAFGMLVLLACGYIIATTIRLRLQERAEELQVMRLMGATERFVRVPFFIEGMLQGVVGALCATGLLYGVYVFVSGRVETVFGRAVTASQLGFLSPSQLAYGIAIGALCGLIGSAAGTRRAVHA